MLTSSVWINQFRIAFFYIADQRMCVNYASKKATTSAFSLIYLIVDPIFKCNSLNDETLSWGSCKRFFQSNLCLNDTTKAFIHPIILHSVLHNKVELFPAAAFSLAWNPVEKLFRVNINYGWEGWAQGLEVKWKKKDGFMEPWTKSPNLTIKVFLYFTQALLIYASTNIRSHFRIEKSRN